MPPVPDPAPGETVDRLLARAGRRDHDARLRESEARRRDEAALAGGGSDDLAAAVRAAARDRTAAATDRAAAAADRAELIALLQTPPIADPDGPDGPEVRLTEREAQVLHGVGQAMSNREIGEQLYLSANTVKTHLRKAFAKIGVHSRVEAVLWLRDRGPSPLG